MKLGTSSKILLAAVLLVSAFGVIKIVGGERSRPDIPTYRIGLGPWAGFGPFYLAQQKGFFEEKGIRVRLIVLTGLAERNSALKSGQIDALAAPVDYFVQSAGNHLETTIVMAIDESVGGDGIVATSSIKQFEDLRGKRVAFQRGLPSEFFLRVLLRDHNMRLEELDTVDMETAQAGAAFIAQKLDAAALWEPWLTKARETRNGRVLASTREYPNLIVDTLAFNKEVVEKAPKHVQAIVQALLKAIDFWKQNPDESNRIMAPYLQVEERRYAEILKGIKVCDVARNRQYFGSQKSPGPIFSVAEKAASVWLEAKVVSMSINPHSVISIDFVKEERPPNG